MHRAFDGKQGDGCAEGPDDGETNRRRVGIFLQWVGVARGQQCWPMFSRFGATRDNLFPADRDAELDVPHVKALGLTPKRMKDGKCTVQSAALLQMCANNGVSPSPRRCFVFLLFPDSHCRQQQNWETWDMTQSLAS